VIYRINVQAKVLRSKSLVFIIQKITQQKIFLLFVILIWI